MGLREKLKAAFSKKKSAPVQKGCTRHDGGGVFVFVRCRRCGEPIRLRLRRTDEMVRSEDPACEFFVQKTIVGNDCFNRIEARFEFNGRHELVNSSISGGTLLTAAEYEAEKAKRSQNDDTKE